MSARVSMSRLFSSACSGAMYSRVPTIWPTSVNIVRSVSFCAVALATPKSITLGIGLPSLLEAGDDVGRVHAGLDDLQGDAPLDRLFLLGEVNRAHAAFAEPLQQLVRPDAAADRFSRRHRMTRGHRGILLVRVCGLPE